MTTSSIVVASTILVFTLYGLNHYLLPRSKLKSIPGPRGVPLLGNLFDWPSEYQAETAQEWKKLHGPIVKLAVFGRTVIWLTSGRMISELFAKRSSTFSDRPTLVFSGELCGLNDLHPMTQFDKDFRQQRKLMKEVLAADVIRKHEALLDEEGTRLLRGTLADPKNFDRCLRRFSSSLSLRLVYGFEALEINDPRILLAEEMMQLSEYAVIAGWAVDFIPWLKYLPRWFPGAGFKKRAEHYRSKIQTMISSPFEEVRRQLSTGHAKDSFAAVNLRQMPSDSSLGEYEKLIKTTATAIYGGASDTTASAAWSFILAMVINQEAQAKAQKEIDLVTGRTRLPQMSDRFQMPYVCALVWETFRWAPPVPVTLPHRARYADELDGYPIKKDDIFLASLWSITRDEEMHASPEEYDPDRYFDSRSERTPYYVFGYGHRRCPGADMAFAQLFHQAAYMLSVFDIRPEVDGAGNPMWPKVEFVGEMVRHPKPFHCSIVPRWKDAALLVGSDN